MNRLKELGYLRGQFKTAVRARLARFSTSITNSDFASFRTLWHKIFPPQKLKPLRLTPEIMHDTPPVSCICLYTGFPERLEEAIYSFLRQNYGGAKELVVLNDYSGHTLLFEHPEVKMINLPEKVQFRRKKWNLAVDACAHNLILVWNADDISLPHRLSGTIEKMSRANHDLPFTPATIFIWENGQVIGPYQNLFHQGNAWSHELYERTGGLKKIEHDTAVFAPQLRTVNQPHYSLLMPEEVFYIFRGLNYISSEPQQHLGEIELKPHWQVDYPRFVQEHLASGIAVEIDRSLPELTFKNRQKLSRYGYLGARRYYVFEDRKLAYISNAKVACTSIKTAMMQPYNIHEQVHNAWPYVYRGALPDEHQDFFTFSFVRNPFDRLVSGYRNKIYSSEKEAYGDISTNITFSEFVTEVVKRPDCLINNHFQSQNCKLYKDGELLVDYLGRFENLAKDWLSIAERFNFTPQLPHKMKSSGKRGAYRDYRDYYTERLVHLVYNRFQTDVEMFGYQKSYEELLAFVREKK